jgi:hypothetical protein
LPGLAPAIGAGLVAGEAKGRPPGRTPSAPPGLAGLTRQRLEEAAQLGPERSKQNHPADHRRDRQLAGIGQQLVGPGQLAAQAVYPGLQVAYVDH